MNPTQSIPLLVTPVSCGFKNATESWSEVSLNLHEHLIHKPAATFFVRAKGDSMIGVGIFEGDLLIVDRSLEAHHKSIVVAVLNGEFTLKRLIKRQGKIFLFPENPSYKEQEITEEMGFEVWGVVTHTIHSLINT